METLQERQAACLRAAGYKKPTKREIINYINELLDEGTPIDPRLVGMVWLYFEQRPSQRAAKDVRYWVAQAASTDPDKPWMTNVRAELGRLVATDGHRMHMAYVSELTDGWLEPTTMTPVECSETFPPYEQVIPARAAEPVSVRLEDFEPASIETVRYGSIHFNRRYIREALAGSERMDMTSGGPLDPVRLDGPDRTAVVMPCRA